MLDASCCLLSVVCWYEKAVAEVFFMYGPNCVERVSLPEWSKGLRSGRNVFERVGLNPTADKSFAATTTKSCHAAHTLSFLLLFAGLILQDTITADGPSSFIPPSSSTFA